MLVIENERDFARIRQFLPLEFVSPGRERDFTGNLERERETLESWAESYPRDPLPHGLVSGLALTSTGQYELAIAEADKAVALDPDLTPAYVNRAINQLFLNRLDGALLTIHRTTERKLESPEWFTQVPYFVAFLKSAARGSQHDGPL